jgi:hypothetical protein
MGTATTPIDVQLETPQSSSVDEVEEETSNDAVAQDAATILEFLAWGRRKDPDCHTVVSLEASDDTTLGTGPGTFDDCSQLSVLQLLLPSPHQVQQLVDYHIDSLLWYHGSYFAPTFRTQLKTFYNQDDGIIDQPAVNLQWVALLFSVLAASLACAPPTRAQSWGFGEAERETLSKRWFQAIVTCLNRADYTSNLNILSCQAIATGTVSAHILGFSNTQSIHLATAVRIAQSLGLHRLGPDTAGDVMENETGRRVWCQLCSQDWFSIPFSESYLISPVYSTSAPPANCHDHDLLAVGSNVPTITSYSRFLNDIAVIMPQLQDGLVSCNTPYTRYEKVLHWDSRLRALATRERPVFMTNTPLDPSWPSWVPWARHALAITSSHKIIMIHRSFLLDSFTNPAFAFTRRTCLAASKTIIKEYKCVIEEEGPILWIHQAFAVAASITLLLDVLHRDPGEKEGVEHRALAQDVVHILRSCQNSMIATRGSKLLEVLLAQTLKDTASFQRRKRNRDGTLVSRVDVSVLVSAVCRDKAGTKKHHIVQQSNMASPSQNDPPPTYQSNETFDPNAADFAQLDFNFSFPASGLGGTNGFDNLLYLANHDFPNM